MSTVDLKTALWEAINRYAISVGGDPSEHVHDNTPRMQAVADVEGALAALVLKFGVLDEAPLRWLLGPGSEAHPGFEAFRRQMRHRTYDAKNLKSAWEAFQRGWTEAAHDAR
jgi:hypothetical protein